MTDKEYIQLSKLLEEKMARIDDKIDHKINLVMVELAHIKEQTTKTNGRVTSIEADVISVKSSNTLHTINCPIKAEVEKIKDDLLEYQMVKKYPKIAIILVAIIAAAYLYSSVEIRSIKRGMDTFNEPTKIELIKDAQ